MPNPNITIRNFFVAARGRPASGATRPATSRPHDTLANHASRARTTLPDHHTHHARTPPRGSSHESRRPQSARASLPEAERQQVFERLYTATPNSTACVPSPNAPLRRTSVTCRPHLSTEAASASWLNDVWVTRLDGASTKPGFGARHANSSRAARRLAAGFTVSPPLSGLCGYGCALCAASRGRGTRRCSATPRTPRRSARASRAARSSWHVRRTAGRTALSASR